MALGKKVLLFTQFMLVSVFMMITSIATERFNELHFTSSDTIMYVNYTEDMNGKVSAFANTLRAFSDQYDVNFIIRRYLSDELVVLYAADIENDARFRSFDKELLKGNNYISSIDTKDQRQIGRIKSYLSDLELRVYDIANIEFSGLEHEIYIYGFQDSMMPNLVESLSSYGDIRVLHSNITLEKLMKRVNMTSALLIMPLVILCLMCMYLVVSIIFVRGQSRLISICRLAGKSSLQILHHMGHVVLRTGIVKVSIVALFSSVLMMLFVRYEIVIYYPHVILIAFIAVVSISLITQMIIAFIVIKGNRISDPLIKKGNKSINMIVLSGAKIIAITVLLYALMNVHSNYGLYNERLISMSNWMENINIHRVIVSSDAAMYRSDLAAESYFNDRCSSLYDQLSIKNKAFIMKSTNFLRVENDKGEGYLYEQAELSRNGVLSPQGMSIVVDKAYLLRNPIISVDDKNVYDGLVFDSNVLNVIVPSKYKDDEAMIQNNYLAYFYFQKVTVDNIYNEALGHPMNEQDKTELEINIIYSKENQNYFTYSSHTGDVYGNIKDPIAIVYNPSVNTSNIMSLLTSSIFFESDSKDPAFFDIASSVKETGITEVKSVHSVFSEVGKAVINAKANIIANLLLILICATAFLSLIVQYTLLFYSIHKKKLTIKYLLGSGFVQHRLYAQIAISNILVLGVVLRFMKNPMLLYVLLLLTFIEIYTVNLICRKNTEKNAGSIVKG